MLAIVNVSPPNTPTTGINQYEVRVNKKVIASFEHDRQYMNAAQCLRDAADAIEKARLQEHWKLVTALCARLESIYPIKQGMKPLVEWKESELADNSTTKQSIEQLVEAGAGIGIKKVNQP